MQRRISRSTLAIVMIMAICVLGVGASWAYKVIFEYQPVLDQKVEVVLVTDIFSSTSETVSVRVSTTYTEFTYCLTTSTIFTTFCETDSFSTTIDTTVCDTSTHISDTVTTITGYVTVG